MPPSIEEIPIANQLQMRLDVLNSAIAALGSGAPVTNLTVGIPADSDPALLVMPIRVDLEPPIDNVDTINTLMAQLAAQADIVEQQLVTMGYAPPAQRSVDVVKEAESSLSTYRRKL